MNVIDFFALLLVLFLAFPGKLYSQATPEDVYKALKTGDLKSLSKCFNSNVYLAVPGIEGVYSQSQCALILMDFFKKQYPKSFIRRNEFMDGKSRCIAGTLYTTHGKYFVLLYYKSSRPEFVEQLRIEDEDN